jgi:hypothetical protein
MNEPYLEHPSEEALERFLLNMSPEEELEALETHVLACSYCVDQLEYLETQIAATRLALQMLESDQAKKKSVDQNSSWKSWFTIPRLSLAGAGAALAAGVLFFSLPRDVNLTAFRGTETAIVSEWRPLRLHLNAKGLPEGPILVELANNSGSIVWKGTSAVGHDTVDVTLPRITKSGPHFLRLYTAPQDASGGELLREFALHAKAVW